MQTGNRYYNYTSRIFWFLLIIVYAIHFMGCAGTFKKRYSGLDVQTVKPTETPSIKDTTHWLSLDFIENIVGVVSNEMIVGSINEDGVDCKEKDKVTEEYLSRLRERGANQPVINAIVLAVANCKDIPIKPPPSPTIATISSPSDKNRRIANFSLFPFKRTINPLAPTPS